MSVYKAINEVQKELAVSGISKDRTNTQGSGYKFRGIDDVYNAISPIMAKHGLCILPRMVSRLITERESQKGNALFYVVVEAEFDFVSAEDGTMHTVRTFGEAMDSGDKATNKAMSAAYKYAAFQTFAIPTEGENDADAATHTVKPTLLHKPAAGAYEGLTADRKQAVENARHEILRVTEDGTDLSIEAVSAAYDEASLLDNDEKIALTDLLGKYSKLRKALKDYKATLTEKKEAA